MPENTIALSRREAEIYSLILSNWPTSALEVAEHFREDISTRENRKRLSTKYSYHIQKLVDKQLVLSKKAGNSLIVWPLKVEKYRAIDTILKEEF